MEDSQTDNNSNCSEGGEKNGQAKIGGFVCVGKALLGRHPWRSATPVTRGELVGASWNCLWLAQGSPSFSSQRFSAVSSGYHNETPVLSTVGSCVPSLSVSLWMAAQASGASASSLVQAAKVLQAHSAPVLNEGLK